MNIKVVSYAPSTSRLVAAFVAIVVDDWLVFHGVNYLRDGTLKSAQLRYARNGQRNFLSAVVIIDDDLRTLVTEEILAAIHAYVAGLPPEQRMRPPRPAAVPPPEKSPTGKKALPPPRRLLVGAMKGDRT